MFKNIKSKKHTIFISILALLSVFLIVSLLGNWLLTQKNNQLLKQVQGHEIEKRELTQKTDTLTEDLKTTEGLLAELEDFLDLERGDIPTSVGSFSLVIDKESGWLKYTDSKYGFSLSLPSNWGLRLSRIPRKQPKHVPDIKQVSRSFLDAIPYDKELEAGNIGMSIIDKSKLSALGLTLEEWLELWKKDKTNSTFQKNVKKEISTFKGLPAIIYTGEYRVFANAPEDVWFYKRIYFTTKEGYLLKLKTRYRIIQPELKEEIEKILDRFEIL